MELYQIKNKIMCVGPGGVCFETGNAGASAFTDTVTIILLPKPSTNDLMGTDSAATRLAIVPVVMRLVGYQIVPPVNVIFHSTLVAVADPTFFITDFTPIPPVIFPILSIGCADTTDTGKINSSIASKIPAFKIYFLLIFFLLKSLLILYPGEDDEKMCLCCCYW